MDSLFLLDPHAFEKDGFKRFCPPCAFITGYLSYYPKVAEKLKIIKIAPPRPRPAIIEVLGEENQGSPVLVLAENSVVPEGIEVQTYQTKRFINDVRAIVIYLSKTHDAGLPLGYEV